MIYNTAPDKSDTVVSPKSQTFNVVPSPVIYNPATTLLVTSSTKPYPNPSMITPNTGTADPKDPAVSSTLGQNVLTKLFPDSRMITPEAADPKDTAVSSTLGQNDLTKPFPDSRMITPEASDPKDPAPFPDSRMITPEAADPKDTAVSSSRGQNVLTKPFPDSRMITPEAADPKDTAVSSTLGQNVLTKPFPDSRMITPEAADPKDTAVTFTLGQNDLTKAFPDPRIVPPDTAKLNTMPSPIDITPGISNIAPNFNKPLTDLSVNPALEYRELPISIGGNYYILDGQENHLPYPFHSGTILDSNFLSKPVILFKGELVVQ
ncbi:hypothetical protein LOTGIDRAFT_115147 [Lottia gigantea]|uniref:Uncharacterized protein n=1 Tax=Lottia gigantea TaxID=225164 RepID=V4AU53_LOTGI|nr:hypothetical protein LOTGIDRAFT_115147 [Lottia gigantea]ESO97306.1 hypothetical protein LOTGIDRAFT_115147 [Lottia gigantea]